MTPRIQFKTITLQFLIGPVLFCMALAPTAQAVSPAPDGSYPGANTAEGNAALFSLTTGSNNTAIGSEALFSLTTGVQNTATGVQALKNNAADKNTAVGFQALTTNSSGSVNTATGWRALVSNTSGGANTANGSHALYHNTDGDGNTAVGFEALFINTSGGGNTAVGVNALASNSADGNTAVGFQALLDNTSAIGNTAIGWEALLNNTGSGAENTATGYQALKNNTLAVGNTATGFDALQFNATGNNNTAIGAFALTNNTGGGNTAVGNTALFNNTGNLNIALGIDAGSSLTTGDHNIDIDDPGVAGDADTIRIGRSAFQTATYIAGISGRDAIGGDQVYITSDGKLGTNHAPSSARFKDEIKPMDKASEVILALKPVTFRYKKEIDPKATPQFGLVAEQVEKVNPDLVKRDRDGKLQTVRYEAVNAMLLNEFLKAHRKMEEQGDMIAKQQKQIEALTVGLEKVTTRLEASKSAPQMASNDSR